MDAGQSRTLWVGDVDPHRIDESSLHAIFSKLGAVKVKLPRDKHSGRALGYGFAEFSNAADAARILETLNGQPIPDFPGMSYRLGRAQHGLGKRKADSSSSNDGSNSSVFLGNLDHNLEYNELQGILSKFGEVKSLSVPRGKGIAFVNYDSHASAERAITELHQQTIGSQPIRATWGRPKPERSYDRGHGGPSYGARRDHGHGRYDGGYDDRGRGGGGYRDRRDQREEPYRRRNDYNRGPPRRRDSPPRRDRDRRPSPRDRRKNQDRYDNKPSAPAAFVPLDIGRENRDYIRLNAKLFLSSTPVFSAHDLNKYH